MEKNKVYDIWEIPDAPVKFLDAGPLPGQLYWENGCLKHAGPDYMADAPRGLQLKGLIYALGKLQSEVVELAPGQDILTVLPDGDE